ncbi:transglycosylase domain-containing protein [Mucilaginibacter sp. Bleaf8]|uniref:transglycosylase domain-containing protein n=1 Tax=Mucilaginibacter sp. Bleaf8 TaxID=2834430 RepID=UPI001BD0C6F6|nr:transglycosylase domain-containing protein [Mucilaginibacter sp. Bleaf8]MBS7564321.1 transglycosylase domain-containing protein [Mucilaginibacter sp. Bleaf8]
MITKLKPEEIRSYNRTLWKIVIGCFAFFVLIMALVAFGIFGPLPSFRDLENPKSNQASEILSSDGRTVLGTYYVQNRSNVNYNQISPNVINALIATEDNRFMDHSGIDFGRTFTIIFYNLIGKKQGGSTITQQLALNLFSERSHNVFKRITQKLQEWIIAVNLERRYTKEEIITMYLNTVDFGAYNTFGIKSASRTYFNTTPDKLTADQAALLIGMVNGPGIYSPIRHPDNAVNRRNFVLRRMAEEGMLSDGQAEEFKQKPLGLNFKPSDHNDGPATYFRAVLRKDVQKILDDQSIVKSDGTPYDLDRDGLRIYTTINNTMQQYAEEAQKEYMRDLQVQFNQHWRGRSLWKGVANFKLLLDQGMKRSDRYRWLKQQGKSDDEIKEDFNTPTTVNLFTWHGNIDTTMKPIDSIVYSKMLLRNAMMSMDPTTGYVKAWVGGINFEHFKYDQVKMGARQVGSTAKPFTYAVAIDNGFSPCMQVNNVPDTIYGYGKPWCPGSSPSETVPGAITLRKALARSQNWVTAHVMKEVTPVPVMQLIKKMGVTTAVPPYPSICLGTFNASVFDMTGAYSAFANHGVWTEPIYLLRIEDKNGNLLYERKSRVVQAMNEQTAYVMSYMLKGVVDEGTGWRLRSKYGLRNPIGGKTGTTQNNSDGWFIGITPYLVTGVWTGCEDRDIHFRSTHLGEGANTALPIFALYMKKVYANQALGIKQGVDFDPPKNGLNIQLDCGAYSQQQQATTEVDNKLGF